MKSSLFALALVLALPIAAASSQTTAPATTAQPQPGTDPVTSQTPAATNGTGEIAPPAATGARPTNKSDRKAKRKSQRQYRDKVKADTKAAKAGTAPADATDTTQPH